MNHQRLLTLVINAWERSSNPQLVQEPAKRVLLSATDAVARVAKERLEVAETVRSAPVKKRVEKVTNPGSLSGGMKKAGIALIAAPDPLTGVPGVALLASSFVLKKREPANLGHLAQETRKILREIQSLRI